MGHRRVQPRTEVATEGSTSQGWTQRRAGVAFLKGLLIQEWMALMASIAQCSSQRGAS